MSYYKSMIVYTFRTFPYVDELKDIFGDVFVFSSLKKDFAEFIDLIKEREEDVLGVALTQGATRQEPVAINRFNTGKISKLGKDTLSLTLLDDIPVAIEPTHTFCNWTMYKIQECLNQQDVSSHFSFVHVNKNDLELLADLSR